jgi:hypothetical protein
MSFLARMQVKWATIARKAIAAGLVVLVLGGAFTCYRWSRRDVEGESVSPDGRFRVQVLRGHWEFGAWEVRIQKHCANPHFWQSDWEDITEKSYQPDSIPPAFTPTWRTDDTGRTTWLSIYNLDCPLDPNS